MAEFLLSFATEVTTTVISLAAQEGSLAWGFKGELTKLKESLETIQAVLQDAEQQQERKKTVRLWLEKLKDIAYEAEDVLDEFAYEFDLPRKLELRDRMKKKVRDFFSPSNPIAFRLKMGHKIQSINMSLDEIKKDTIFGILSTSLQRPAVPTSQIDQNPRETHSFVDDSQVVGREDDVAKIVKMLTITGNQEVLSVIAIVGIGGLGKTTLAQSVYNNDEIKRYFDKRIWVCVSDIFEDKRILRECLESLNPGKGKMENKDAILKNLQEALVGKRYLLVLDDVWNEDSGKWESLKSCLLGLKTNSTGNCVLVTARSNGVASIIETLLPSYRYHLGGLANDECWSIFKNKAFADGGAPMTSELEKIGREIVKKCAGVPLAAKVLGGMMHSKTEKDDWLSVQNIEIWSLPEHQNGILPVLKLSFDHLPSSSLKQCFAYCSMFPKDFVIDKDNLVQLWMAQGLLQPSPKSNQEMEDLGYNYFNILLAKSFFQDAKKDLYGSIENFKMHDLMHDLAQEVSRVDSLTLEPNKDVNDTKEIRHLSLISTEEILPTMQKESGRKMRTLFVTDMDVRNMSLSNLKGLRVLNLQGACIVELPNSIGKLKHLRYLNVSGTRIKMLPKSIGKLYNLQTLRLEDCKNLRRLPNELKNLINLRHLCADWFLFKEMPIEMGRLTCLQTLPIFIVEERGHQIEELERLNQLRGKLIIRNLKHVRDGEAAKKVNLLMKTNIHELRFEWNFRTKREGNNNDEDVLEGLQPHPNLKSLEICGFIGNKFPSWVMKMMVRDVNVIGFYQLKNLVKIKLDSCKNCEQIPKLGHLPCLKYLEINGMDNVKCIEDEFYGYNDETLVPLFPSLETFLLAWMRNLVEWMEATAMRTAGVVVFPRLEKLHLWNCPELTTAPTNFSSLRELDIRLISSSMPLENISSNLTTLTDLNLYRVLELSFLPEGLLQNNKNLASLSISSCPALISLSIPDVSGCCTSLRSLCIVDCEKLRYLSNGLHTLMSLEELEISNCCDLESIPSMHGLTSLRKLKISGCNALTSLPSGLQFCTTLENLEVVDCLNLISVPEDSLELCSLLNLIIQNCERLKRLPQGLRRLKKLEIVGLSKELMSLPNHPQHLTALTHLSIRKYDGAEPLLEWLGSLSSLEGLNIFECPNLKCLPEGLTRLKKLEIVGLSKELKSLPDQLQHLTALTTLDIWDFDGLVALPEWLGNLSSLESLEIHDCENLMHLPTVEAMQRLTRLESLTIYGCRKLKCLPEGLTGLKSLFIGRLSEELKSLPDDLHQHLTSLVIWGLDGLEALPGSLGNLEKLDITECPKLKCFPEGFTQLKSLTIGGLSEDLKSLPDHLQHLTALIDLEISDFNQTKALPEWLGNLSSLQFLSIRQCKNLMYLPTVKAMRRLTKLQELTISRCPLLEERCARGSGPEWFKISHIPEVEYYEDAPT